MARLTSSEYAKLYGKKAGQQLARERANRFNGNPFQVFAPGAATKALTQAPARQAPVAAPKRPTAPVRPWKTSAKPFHFYDQIGPKAKPFGLMTPSQSGAKLDKQIAETKAFLATPAMRTAAAQMRKTNTQNTLGLIKTNKQWNIDTNTPIGVMQKNLGTRLRDPNFKNALDYTMTRIGSRKQLVQLAAVQAEQPLSKMILQANLDWYKKANGSKEFNGKPLAEQWRLAGERVVQGDSVQAVNPFDPVSVAQTADYFGKKIAKAVKSLDPGTGYSTNTPLAAATPGSSLLQGGANVGHDLIMGAAQNAAALPLGLVAGGYQTGSDVVHGEWGAVAHDLGGAYVEFAKDPVNYARHNPLNTFFLFSPAGSLIGRGAGAAMRSAAFKDIKIKNTTLGDMASTVRVPVEVSPGNIQYRQFSKNVIVKAAQAWSDNRRPTKNAVDRSLPNKPRPSIAEVAKGLTPLEVRSPVADVTASAKAINKRNAAVRVESNSPNLVDHPLLVKEALAKGVIERNASGELVRASREGQPVGRPIEPMPEPSIQEQNLRIKNWEAKHGLNHEDFLKSRPLDIPKEKWNAALRQAIDDLAKEQHTPAAKTSDPRTGSTGEPPGWIRTEGRPLSVQDVQLLLGKSIPEGRFKATLGRIPVSRVETPLEVKRRAVDVRNAEHPLMPGTRTVQMARVRTGVGGKWSEGPRLLRRAAAFTSNWIQKVAWADRNTAVDAMRSEAPYPGAVVNRTKRAANDIVAEVAMGSILKSTAKFPTRFKDQLVRRLEQLRSHREDLVGQDLVDHKQLAKDIKTLLDLPAKELAAVEKKVGVSARLYAAISHNLDRLQNEHGVMPKEQTDMARLQRYAVQQMDGQFLNKVENHPSWSEYQTAVADSTRKGWSQGRRDKANDRAVELQNEMHDSLSRMTDPLGKPITIADIKAHMRANDVNMMDIAHVPTARGQSGSKNYHRPFDFRKRKDKTFAFTGQNLRQGTYGSRYNDLVDHVANRTTLISHIDSTNRALEQFGTIPELNGIRVDAGPTLENARHNARIESGYEFVPIREVIPKGTGFDVNTLADLGGTHGSQSLNDLVSHALTRRIETPKPGERVILVPKIVVDEVRAQNKAAERNWLLSPITNAFRRTVLPLSSTVHLGDIVEGGVRTGIEGAGVKSNLVGRQIIKAGSEIDLKRMNQIKQTLLGNTRMASQQRFITRGTSSAKIDTIPYVGAAVRVASGLSQALYAVNKTIVSQYEIALLGKRLAPDIARHADIIKMNHDMGQIVDLQAQATRAMVEELMGKTGDPKMAQARILDTAKHLEQVLGRYQNFSPHMRWMVSNVTPFLPWAFNAVRFFTHTLPVKHPLITALLVNMESAVTQEYKDMMKSLATTKGGKISPTVRYGNIPAGNGSTRPIGHFLPASALYDPLTLAADEVFPQFAGTVLALIGQTWQHRDAMDENGKKIADSLTARLIFAIAVTAETYIPGLSQARRIAQNGHKAYDNSYPFHIRTKPEKTGSAFDVFNPLHTSSINGSQSSGVDAFGRKVETSGTAGGRPGYDAFGNKVASSDASKGRKGFDAFGRPVKN